MQNYIANNGFAFVPKVKSRSKSSSGHGDEDSSDAASVSSTITVDESLSDDETVSVTSVGRTKQHSRRKASRSTKRKQRRSRCPSPLSRSSASESEDDFDFEHARGIQPLPIRRPPFFNGLSQGTVRPGGYVPHQRLQHNRHHSFPALASMGTAPVPVPAPAPTPGAAPRPPAPPSSSTPISTAANPPPSYQSLGMGHPGSSAEAPLPSQAPKLPGATPVTVPTPAMATTPIPTAPPRPLLPTSPHPGSTNANPQQPHLIDAILLIHWRRPGDHYYHHHNNNNNNNAPCTPRAVLQQLPSPLTIRHLQDAALAYVRRQPEHHKDMLLVRPHGKNHRVWQLRVGVKRLIVSGGGGKEVEEYDLSGYNGGADLTGLVVATGNGKGRGGLPRVEVEVCACESQAQAVAGTGMLPASAAGTGVRSGGNSSGSGSGAARQVGGIFFSVHGAPAGVASTGMGVGVPGLSKLPAPAVQRYQAHQTASGQSHDQGLRLRDE